ncbi:AraC family transcriptional regulator [Dyadobacter sp. CY323]|uniref:helix-turn-helix domain-containing protein n=1 Tax=Dyadobacter sp. CY323 TaxID=2907302 RepID=UPI001F1E1E3E|nr:helix-turn-helix transcriptional regulator [Dyadobacter sp. CY323]MCE6987831.1 helix-turn-helix transcriptional regulator [Dyadobacter sp. CY323]
MKKTSPGPLIINSLSEYHKIMKLPQPEHPLISVIGIECASEFPDLPDDKLIHNFYSIFLKKNIEGSIGYGRKYYDFSNGVMGFSLPKHVFVLNRDMDYSTISGWMLLIHPDFIRNYPLAKRIAEYGFFSYDMSEALHLSEKEETMIERIMEDIRSEYQMSIDAFSQDVIVSHIEVLLNYCNRFYNRQFITRRPAEQEPVARFEEIVSQIFNNDEITHIPGVNEIAAQMNVSTHYLSDMLRSLTGMNAQQHIHNKLIDKAKELLLTTNLSVNETAYNLGFEYPQYFNRLFKSKTGLTPAAFRKDFSEN